ncbi:AbrB/MazE/SpoVT family DNA-binding domain-containing protein [Paenibacillus koleovorans]|uniref:AbrB/MazE/SpoVT family DNA-binding domain-containing protein n=1 Tax=Paenibacillus koleovorans TaxID=121608 RepID=UPI000FD9B4ED|nr:AbrB/MazE/SpoVT family DNA-binding domain-containing protein [Paenibacillus koleovorans]
MLKSTGVVRRVDELGRIVLPMELRRTLGIEEKDQMEIYVDGDRIMLRKYKPGCVFCGGADIKIAGMEGGKLICRSCTTKIINANIQVDLQPGSGPIPVK